MTPGLRLQLSQLPIFPVELDSLVNRLASALQQVCGRHHRRVVVLLNSSVLQIMVGKLCMRGTHTH